MQNTETGNKKGKRKKETPYTCGSCNNTGDICDWLYYWQWKQRQRDAKNSDPPASGSIQQSQPLQSPSSEPDSGKESELAYNVDWDKCLDDLKESVLNQEFFPYANDVYVAVDEEKKQITFSAVVGDATDPSVALDYADTIVRQYNLMANMQDSNIALGSKDYYGGLYDKYDILVGIAPQSKVDDSDQWFVYDASIAGAHKEFKLQKQYR